MDYNLPEHWKKQLDNHKIIGLVSTGLSKASDMLLFSNCGSIELMKKNLLNYRLPIRKSATCETRKRVFCLADNL